MTSHNQERRGEAYAFLLSLFEGFFPIFSLFSVAALGAIHSYFYTLLMATPILLLIQWRQGKLHELFKKDAYLELGGTAFFITLLFLSIFIALQYTTPSNVAVIMTMQLFFSYLFFNVIGRQHLTKAHSLGAFFMGLGAIIILLPDEMMLNSGDLIVLFGAAIAPFANYYQKKARAKVASVTILTFRNLLALPVLFVLATITERFVNPMQEPQALMYLLLNAVLVFVIAKILWIESLNLISITKLAAMVSFIPLFTVLFSYFILGVLPELKELLGFIPIFLGSYLITRP